MKEITCANHGISLLDDEDYLVFKSYVWKTDPKGYIFRSTPKGKVFLHSEVVKFRTGHVGGVDHKNRIPNDNQFDNLRPATKSENSMNQGVRRDSTSGYKGVTYSKEFNCYVARIQFRDVRIWLGKHKDAESAARAYDRAALQYHKAFAWINFPEIFNVHRLLESR